MAIESEMREALVNLVLNATDAMPEGGRLTLRAGHTLASAKGVSRRVFIEVVDTGVGMDEATRRRCLEPFFTTKGERGTGLGLAMVYGIAQRHGVDLDIHSAPGDGTTIRLTFP
jgi:signal transduction histidine kinase